MIKGNCLRDETSWSRDFASCLQNRNPVPLGTGLWFVRKRVVVQIQGKINIPIQMLPRKEAGDMASNRVYTNT